MAGRSRKDATRKPAAEWMGRATVSMIRMLPMLLLLGGVAWGGTALWQEALNDPQFRIAGDTLSLAGDVSVAPDTERELKRLGRVAAGRSLLEGTLLRDVAQAYSQSPWVSRVCSIRRVFPNRVEVAFVLRSPFAQVKQGRPVAYYWMVDEEGTMLPVPGRQTAHADMPEIVGAVTHRPQDGKAWMDVGVRDALGVLKVLRASALSEELAIRRIVVRRGAFLDALQRPRQSRARIDLETMDGRMIRWGTFNGKDLPDELRNQEKLAMLRSLLEQEVALIPGVCLDVCTREPTFSLPPAMR